MKLILPIAVISLSFGAGLVYIFYGEPIRGFYWISAGAVVLFATLI